LRYAAKKSKSPSEIAHRALEISRELEKENAESGKEGKKSSIFGFFDDIEDTATEIVKSAAELAAEHAKKNAESIGETLPLTGIESVDIDLDELNAPATKLSDKLSTRTAKSDKAGSPARPSPFAIPTLTPPTPYDH
jgi:hypothetical protein